MHCVGKASHCSPQRSMGATNGSNDMKVNALCRWWTVGCSILTRLCEKPHTNVPVGCGAKDFCRVDVTNNADCWDGQLPA